MTPQSSSTDEYYTYISKENSTFKPFLNITTIIEYISDTLYRNYIYLKLFGFKQNKRKGPIGKSKLCIVTNAEDIIFYNNKYTNLLDSSDSSGSS